MIARQGNLFLPGATVRDEAGATLDPSERYRYSLWRRWDMDAGGLVLFVMLNPSTADHRQDDPTIRRCIGFAKREGAGAIEVVNLFAWRSPDPEAILHACKAGMDIVGPKNDDFIKAASQRADRVVVAWGDWPARQKYRLAGVSVFSERVAAVCTLLAHREVVCLGRSKAHGAPRHPLYVRGDAPLEVYRR